MLSSLDVRLSIRGGEFFTRDDSIVISRAALKLTTLGRFRVIKNWFGLTRTRISPSALV